MAVWSVVNLHDVFGAIRLDAEFYQPKYQENQRVLSCLPHTTLGSICPKFVKGIFDIKAEDYVEEGIPFARIGNLKNCIVDSTSLAYLTPERHRQESKTALEKYDIVLSKTAYPAASLVMFDQCNTSQDTIAIKTNRSKDFNIYLVVFLNTRPGLMQLERLFQGNIQSHLLLNEARTVLVPIPDEHLQAEVKSLFERSLYQREASQSLYAEAERLLLRELRLDTLDLAHQLTYERNFNELLDADRFDADYFHPEKYHILEQLNALPGRRIDQCFIPVAELYDGSKDDTGGKVYNYDLTDALRYFLDEQDGETMYAAELGSAKKRFQHGDVVVSRLRSYLKEIAVVNTRGEHRCVASSEFIVLRPQDEQVTSELLMVYLRSTPIQRVLKWCQDGSNHPRFKEKEILSLNIPQCVLDVQPEVTKLIRQGIEAHQEARQLLEAAKKRVEDMILMQA